VPPSSATTILCRIFSWVGFGFGSGLSMLKPQHD
jgi:hypothetical protein